MTAIIFTISVVGLLAGFFSSMPVAGPISVIITSNALRGRLRYCNSLTLGASFGTFTYVFIAAFGLTKLFALFKTAVPFLLLASFGILMIVGLRIFRTKIDTVYFKDNNLFEIQPAKSERDGFYTGLIINFLNPTLLIGWIMNTFMVISFTASLGLNTGGLDIFIHKSAKEINNFIAADTIDVNVFEIHKSDITRTSGSGYLNDRPTVFPQYFHITISVLYALFAAAGSIIWFFILAVLIIRFRKFLNFKVISVFIKSMGAIVCLFGLYFGYLAFRLFLHLLT
jgi:threonine/homoserine/homoserine lactone efflux protein